MAKYKRSSKGYAPFTTVKPKSKIKRTLYELIHGSKAYIPRNEQDRKDLEQISRWARKTRKMQSKVYGKNK